MFKRKNKITALLVAAASIMSVVPAMAADSTTSRLQSNDGNITNAIAYSDGKYAYQGYKSSDDTDEIYYNDGTQDKALDDLSSADLNTTYADKYAFANDGSDQYLVDLTNGDISSDTTPSDDIDTAATKLQTKLNKADRYKKESDITVDASDLENGQDTSNTDSTVFAIPGDKFGDTWYSYAVTPNSSDADSYVGKDGKLYGFTDGNGKYVDASYTANIYAYSTKEGRTVKINNYSNNYSDQDSDSGLLATLVKQPVALTQDKDYIYALVTVAITDTSANSRVTGGTTTDSSAYVDGAANQTGTTTIRTYVQKISKTQGDQKDDAYLPKTVDSYEIGNADGKEYDSGDASDAYTAFQTATGVNDLTQVTQADVINVDSSRGISRPKFTINNGSLVAIEASTDKVDAVSLDFKKDKVKFLAYPGYKDDTLTATTTSATASFDTNNKVDTYLMEKNSDDSFDVNNNSDTDYTDSYDVDVNGNIWGVADGKIYKYENGSMTEVYTCDSSLDSISVYDDNSMIAWENNGDIYTTVNGGNASTTTPPATTTGTPGWTQLADGTWNYYDATGTKVVNNWADVGGVWYYLGADGAMATGWFNSNGTWYYLKSSGAMATGWVNDNGTWYYLNASGAMATGWINDNGTWYFLKSSGAMATGWVNDNGTWYYLNASGAMLSNTTVDGYVLNASGAWIQ
ncbi:N-acetylmuramoyl-L-alanine amidase family protein [Clostridium sp. BL-8]|uniref:N-acetylmuramoyl-L-alanine amidase family protein n=1 Tax=Clostridium sp. BL-8 TaxID=349938 RepID=UPI00098C611A|nr:N-acetylmuramoyl-L-alanine amidase family protein [Clostridium sp. BL-8]OOM75220.1 putative endo-beta-N-acetylglucosaminidase precursor [Clostridium sp. BL-8]